MFSDSEPLDSDGLVSHHNHLQRRMVQIFSSHQAEVNALKRDLHMSRLALTQAGIKPETILTTEDPHQDPLLDGRSGVESTTSEVLFCYCTSDLCYTLYVTFHCEIRT